MKHNAPHPRASLPAPTNVHHLAPAPAKTLACCAAIGFALFSGASLAETPAGKATFERYCAACHAPGHGHPGTQQLGWTRGEAAAVLQQRKNLAPAYIKHVVRHGLLEMPPYRPSEIDDAALDALALYLAKP